ncbi:circadian clock protein, KaiC [Rhodopirellula europaea 6C]|uniref:non-specific serine/threonine protein kinase n=2 Tax=Rhodopirellula TaxID=265488 RepID=M2ATC1_9BACT|nr:circadian clock protein, KaiC [Rhodopirellula europaea 6C]
MDATEQFQDQIDKQNESLISTGNDHLDYILGGGLSANCFVLIEGDPGVGKTTMAMQFALEGIRQGESVLYLSLSEGEEELRSVAASHGFDLEGLTIVDLSPGSETLGADEATIFHPSEVELTELTQAITNSFEEHQPNRVVIDTLRELRHLAQSDLRYRRQLIALKAFFRAKDCTVLLIDDLLPDADLQLQGVVRGAIELQRHTPDYGRVRRRLQVTKMRGHVVRTGYHDFTIVRGGLAIYPRLVAAEHHTKFDHGAVSGGVPELDELLGGGLQRGTSTLIIGAAGTGKSSLTANYAVASANQQGRSAIFVFDETAQNYLERCEGLNIPLRKYRDDGRITLRQVDSAELSPSEFAWHIRRIVEEDNVRFIAIDSLNGYMHSMPDDDYLRGQLHELLSYLNGKGVTTLITLSQHGMVGDVESPVETSYLADTNILLRYFEHQGKVRKAISVIKKRTGGHEKAIRELAFTSDGIRIGGPLTEFRGVLTGTPEYFGDADPLLTAEDDR